MTNLLKLEGIYKVSDTEIRVETGDDILKYYRWLHNRATYNIIQTQNPRHGAHINVIRQKFHKVNCEPFKHLNGSRCHFEIDVRGIFGGFKKGFLNFYLPVYCQKNDEIREYYGFSCECHLTIFNTKNI